MIRVGEFEKAVGNFLRENGWYHNGGWRRDADRRMGAVAMPPALSAGEAVDETIGQERARTAGAARTIDAFCASLIP